MSQVWPGLIAAAVLAVTTACVDAPSAPSNYAPFAKPDIVVGTGAEAATGKTVTVDYTGWLYDPTAANQRGAQFDSSIGRTPLVFTLGLDQVIEGWEQGVPGMKVGGTRRLVIPPSLAYGDTRRGSIPPNSTLIFDVTLLDVQ